MRYASHFIRRSLFVECGGPARDPLYLWQISEDVANDGKAASVELIGGGDPTHHFAGRAGEAFVDGVVHAVVRLADPTRNLLFVFPDNLDRAIGRAAVDDEILEIGIILTEDRADGLPDVFGGVVDGRDESDARQRHA